MSYDIVKALHVISIIAWMAGLLYVQNLILPENLSLKNSQWFLPLLGTQLSLNSLPYSFFDLDFFMLAAALFRQK